MATGASPGGGISLVWLSGSALALEPAPLPSEEVAALRSRAAEAAGLEDGLLGLAHGGKELDDGQSVEEALGTAGPAEITVVRRPCRASPEDYEDLIERFDGVSDEEACMFMSRMDFPEPADININMMPFVIGDQSSLPEYCHPYWHFIRCCLDDCDGHIGYLTIQESFVKAGETQRRPGLHVECPGTMTESGKPRLQYWGGGEHRMGTGGIYMCSSVSGTCRIWPAIIPGDLIGHLGDVEHLREELGEGELMEANEVMWITDATPHEALPMEEDGYRQFIRVVGPEVAIWYEQHNTKNPLGIVPDPKITKVLSHSKFEASAGSSC